MGDDEIERVAAQIDDALADFRMPAPAWASASADPMGDMIRMARALEVIPPPPRLFVGDKPTFVRWMTGNGVTVRQAAQATGPLDFLGIPVRVDANMPPNMIRIENGDDVQYILIEEPE